MARTRILLIGTPIRSAAARAESFRCLAACVVLIVNIVLYTKTRFQLLSANGIANGPNAKTKKTGKVRAKPKWTLVGAQSESDSTNAAGSSMSSPCDTMQPYICCSIVPRLFALRCAGSRRCGTAMHGMKSVLIQIIRIEQCEQDFNIDTFVVRCVCCTSSRRPVACPAPGGSLTPSAKVAGPNKKPTTITKK